MENSLKGLILAAGVVITCIVVGLGFYISREAKNTSSGGITQITRMNSEFQDVDKTMYEGMNVTGREVVEVIEKFSKDIDENGFYIKVCTGKKSAGITYDKTSHSTTDAKKRSSDSYINPDGSFVGSVEKDANQVIIGMTFTQK